MQLLRIAVLRSDRLPFLNLYNAPMTPSSPDTALVEARNASWTRYWSSGVLHSCAGSFAGNYDGAIADFWRDAFSGLTGAMRVLDIATGNGPLPRMLLGLDGCHDSGCRVDAIDLAQLAPKWTEDLRPDQRDRLGLHSGVMAESLPFEAATFELVISQYGIEYADPVQAFAEVARVLKPGGRLRLVMHHADSVPVNQGRVEVPQSESVLGESGLIETASRLLPWLALANAPGGLNTLRGNAQASADRAEFNKMQQQLQSDIDAAGNDAELLSLARDQVQMMLAMVSSQGLDAARAALDRMRDIYQEHLLRVRELCVHALDADRMRDQLRHLGALGFVLASARPLHYQSKLMGWALSAERS